MGKIIDDIFNKYGQNMPDSNGIEDNIAEKIDLILESFADEVPPELYQKISAAIWETAYVSEMKGFELGMKYFAKLIAECLS